MHLLLSARPTPDMDAVSYSLRYWHHEESWLYQEKPDYAEDGTLPVDGDYGDRWKVLQSILQDLIDGSPHANSK